MVLIFMSWILINASLFISEQKVPFEDILLSQEDDDYTFFAPSDEAMDEFLSRFAGPAVGTEYEVLQFLK